MPEMFIILVVVLLLFGSKRLPELAKIIGKSMREFRKAAEEVKREIDISDDL
ncbi:twin-arginine translocase TatA/TatE family subunit [candidate division KSB1 bacterium]|nr:twin-arginine translocase TatA/TatE family subunit [candidate division KSB1 bacterium]